jgi:RNA polymerase sigma-70 factor (ECF subfamily)
MTDPVESLFDAVRRARSQSGEPTLLATIDRLAGEVARQINETSGYRNAADLLDCAETLIDLNCSDAAQTLLHAMRAILPETDELAIRVLNRQARAALACGSYAKARELLEEAYIDAGRTRSPLIGPVLANLAAVCLVAGDMVEARRRIVDARKAGGGHGTEAVVAAVAGKVARLSSDPQSAEQEAIQQRNATVAYLENSDSKHQFALSAFGAVMAAEFEMAGTREGARSRALRAIDALEIAARRCAATLGARHPQSLVAAANMELAQFESARDANDPEAGERVLRRMRSTCERMQAVLGYGHPRSLLTETNVASADFELARMRGSIDEARAVVTWMESVSDRLAAVLGTRHPRVLLSLANLASAQLDVARCDGTQDDARRALDTLEAAAAGSNAVFGNLHPATRLLDVELGLCQQLISDEDATEGGALLTRQRRIVRAMFDDEYLPFDRASVELGTTVTPEPTAAEERAAPTDLDAALPQLAALDRELESESVSVVDQDDLNVVVAAAVAGDRAAKNRLLGYIQPLVLRYCRARIGRLERSFASADDVAQEVCLAILTALGSYRDQGRPFLAFVYGIAAHKVADAHRAAARNRAEPVAELPDEPEAGAGPEQQAMTAEATSRMQEMLSVLPAKQREIVILRVVVGLSAEETADAVGSTPGAVRVAQQRALARLRSATD